MKRVRLRTQSLAARTSSVKLAVAQSASPGDELKARIDKAIGFIRATTARDTQDETYKLLGLIWAGAPAAEAEAQAGRLLALQRAEGGWNQVPTMA